MTKPDSSQNPNTANELQKNLIDLSLERVLKRIRIRAKRRIAWLRKIWSEEGISGGQLAVTHAEIDTYLENRDSPKAEAAWLASDERMKELNSELAEVEGAIIADKKSRLGQIRQMFSLSEKDFNLLQACLAVQLDPSLARVCAYLHDHAGRGYVTKELVRRLFGYSNNGFWNPESPLHKWQLVQQREIRPGEPPQLTCDTIICDWLQGNNHLDEALVNIAKVYEVQTPLENWPVDENVAFLKKMFDVEQTNNVRLCVVGPPGSGRRTFAANISSRFGYSLLAINTYHIDDNDWRRIFIRAQRQAYLDNSALAWFGESVIRREWPQRVQSFPLQFIICDVGGQPQVVPGLIDHRVELPVLSSKERRELWKRFLPVSETWENKQGEEFDKLISQYRINVGDIANAQKRKIETIREAITLIRESSRHRLGKLAQLLECPFKWDDLVIPKSLHEILKGIEFEAKQRAAFWEQPKARRLFPQGRGLLTLFSGVPGTGKTMAAQVITSSLGLDLYRIDLSAVVSKYVGETSQNIDRILSRAAQMDIVLLFDEADALFGKRTEIRDAHDRFANTDTSYLLQAVENYRGIVIMATNKKGNIDPAFIRRIRYVLEFPKPDVKQRELIWQKIVHQLAGEKRCKALVGGLRTLASNLDITGAQIKFAVLAAIFVAKQDKKPLAMSHLLRGIDRELMKEGRALSSREQERLMYYVK